MQEGQRGPRLRGVHGWLALRIEHRSAEGPEEFHPVADEHLGLLALPEEAHQVGVRSTLPTEDDLSLMDKLAIRGGHAEMVLAEQISAVVEHPAVDKPGNAGELSQVRHRVHRAGIVARE